MVGPQRINGYKEDIGKSFGRCCLSGGIRQQR